MKSASTRRVIWFLVVPVLLMAGFVTLIVLGVWPLLAPTAGQADAPPPLASVSLPVRPNSLAWSLDGSYLAASTWGGPGEGVYVVDVAKGSVLTTLPMTLIQALAFSPDGKWLAVGTRQDTSLQRPAGAAPAELVVFDVPAFTAKFTAKARVPEGGFVDLAWSADSKSLHAIDGPADFAPGTAELRRWAVPAFTEHEHAICATQDRAFTALAVSLDGRTLAVAERIRAPRIVRLIRVFELGERKERLSFETGDDIEGTRLGFTSNGKAVGVFDRNRLSWWDVATGRSAKPSAARFASQPAGLTYPRCDADLSLDGNWHAHGYERHRGLGDLGWDSRAKEFGTFIRITESATAKTWTWRVSKAQLEMPAVAFSPDGKKLAGTVWQPSGGSIEIWPMPK